MRIQTKPKLAVEFNVVLTEEEARALCTIVSYGEPTVVACLVNGLSPKAIGDQEAGLLSFLTGIRQLLTPEIKAINNLRKTMKNE